MKRLLPLGVGLATSLACQAPTFPVQVRGETTVKGGIAGAVLSAFPTISSFTSLDFDASHEFRQQGVTKAQISSLQVTELKLKVLNPPEQDFAFLDSLELVARSGDSETRVAERSGIAELGLPAPYPVLDLNVTGAELKDHLNAPVMNLIMRGRGRQPASDTRLEAVATLQAQVF